MTLLWTLARFQFSFMQKVTVTVTRFCLVKLSNQSSVKYFVSSLFFSHVLQCYILHFFNSFLSFSTVVSCRDSCSLNKKNHGTNLFFCLWRANPGQWKLWLIVKCYFSHEHKSWHLQRFSGRIQTINHKLQPCTVKQVNNVEGCGRGKGAFPTLRRVQQQRKR